MISKYLMLGFALTGACVQWQSACGQDLTTLTERFHAAEPYQVELKVRLAGRLAVPLEPGKPPQVLPMSGESTLLYDEKVLSADEPRTGKVIRRYREVTFERTIGGKEQKAEIRPAVRRMVVLRSDSGKKAPFSPDGPLMWGEIDVVRTDIFTPVLVTGLLPTKPVRPGDRWRVAAATVTELTDLDPIEEGDIQGEFVSVVMLNNKKYAKLTVSGAVKGGAEDGPSRQKLDGTAYFDLEANRLTYLNLRGTRELLGPDGKTVMGKVDGTFVMTRSASQRAAELSDAELRNLDLRPTATNTELLYDNPDLGIKFLYPRRWRVGTVQGRQLTIDEANGGGIMLTVEPTASLPTVDQYLSETRDFLRKQKWSITGTEAPRRVSDRPTRLDRFAFDAEINKEKLRLEYAVLSQAEGGATVSARLPKADREDLERDLERILRTLSITKRIEK